MTAAYHIANLQRYLALIVCGSVGLWAFALLSCLVLSVLSRPSQLLTTEVESATGNRLQRFAPSLAAVAPQSADQLSRHTTIGKLLHTLSSAAAATDSTAQGSYQNRIFSAALSTELHNTSVATSSHLCSWLRNDLPPTTISPQQTVFLAGLLTNNEALMPHYILQLLEFASAMPAGSLFVSIYESGSTDRTGLWLAALAELLATLGVPHHIQSGASTRREGEGRIPFLARVRNKVLEPLHWPSHVTREDVMQPADSEASSSSTAVYSSIPGRSVGRTDASSSGHSGSNVSISSGDGRASSKDHMSSSGSHSNHMSSSSSRLDKDKWLFRADKVVFLNDVYFCAQHIHRLLAHDGVNLACGLDYYKAKGALKLPASWRVGMWGMQPLLLRFYDNWVARDAEGTIFRRGFDHVARDAYGNHRMQQGLAFPVTCCWNGLAVFDAAPLQQAKVQFRAALQQDCPASECSHFCEDLRRMGLDKMIVDPAVRLGYTPEVAAALDQGKWQTFVPWALAKQNPADWSQVPQKPEMMCCPAPEIQACYRRSIYKFDDTKDSV